MWTREDIIGGEIDFFHFVPQLCHSWFSQVSLFSGHITCMWMKNVQLSDKNGQISLDYTFQSCRELENVQIFDLPLKPTYINHTRRCTFTRICWTARLINWSKSSAGVRKPPGFFFPRRVYSFASYLFMSLFFVHSGEGGARIQKEDKLWCRH